MVVVITGILLAVGVPQFQQFIARRNVEAQVASLNSAFRLARAEAVKRGRLVTLCRSADAEAAAPVCGGADPNGLGWAAGWIVFEDDTVGGTRGVVDAGETIILSQGAFASSGGITSGTGGNGYLITYQATGIPVRNNNNTTFTILPKGGTIGNPLTRQLVVSAVGRIEVR